MKVENIKYDSFQEFFMDTLPTGELGKKLDGYIFRGESSAKYELLPSALRKYKDKVKDKDHQEKLYSVRGIPVDDQAEWESWQIRTEMALLREFYKTANNNGLKIPYIESIRRNYTEWLPFDTVKRDEQRRNKQIWISRDFEELAALAQHYGVFTRLLDWTFDLYVSMYFASISAIRKYDKITDKTAFEEITSDSMVFWLLDAPYIQFLQPTVARIPLNFVVPPYYNNANLNAQKGILSYWEVEVEDERAGIDKWMNGISPKRVDRTPLDKLIEAFCAKENFVLLYKLEVPTRCCAEMYSYIGRLGYSAARIFPGYEGVVRKFEEDKLSRKVGKIIETKSE